MHGHDLASLLDFDLAWVLPNRLGGQRIRYSRRYVTWGGNLRWMCLLSRGSLTARGSITAL